MATPASRFRPHGPTRDPTNAAPDPSLTRPSLEPPVREPDPAPAADGVAVEFEARVPPRGTITVMSGKQHIDVHPALAGRTLTIWADQRSIHLILDGHVLRTVSSRLLPADLKFLTMRGARPAGPPPRPYRGSTGKSTSAPVRPSSSTAKFTATATSASPAAKPKSVSPWPAAPSLCASTDT